LPTIRETFSITRREEARKSAMMVSHLLLLLLPRATMRRERKLEKDHFASIANPWHTRETCQKLHGKPPKLKKKGGNEGCSL